MAGESQSLVRGLSILAAFRRDRPLLGISELARNLELTRSTTHRYVSTLLGLGYLQQDAETRKYRLGPRVLDLGLAALESMELREHATPTLRRLTQVTGYTSNLAVLDGDEIVHIERIRAPEQRAVDLDIHIGSRLPVYCSALGKALLAFQPDAERKATLARIRFVRLGPNTLTQSRPLEEELARIREAGYAINNEELAPGLRSIAAPLRDRSGEVIASINVAAHYSGGTLEDLLSRLLPPLLRAADEISSALGYRAETRAA